MTEFTLKIGPRRTEEHEIVHDIMLSGETVGYYYPDRNLAFIEAEAASERALTILEPWLKETLHRQFGKDISVDIAT